MINIKFRGKNKSGKFIFGYYVFDEEWAKHYIYTVGKMGVGSVYSELFREEVEESSINQSMNIRDSYGQEIFGGDVVEWVNSSGEIMKQVINFNTLNGCWCIGKLSWENFVKSGDMIKDFKLKVIGQVDGY